MAYDPYVGWSKNRNRDNDAVESFLSGGGEVKRFRAVDKSFRESPKKDGAIFVFNREERLSAE